MTFGLTHPVRQGLSMLEVMIAVAILASALATMIGTLYTLHQSRATIDEDIKVQAIAQSMVERLQGSLWDDLGKDNPTIPGRNEWSWHRRATKQLAYSPTMVNAPMTDKELIETGIISQQSGIPGLQVYLEYYQTKVMDTLANTLSINPKADPRKVWKDLVGDPETGASPTGTSSKDAEIYLPEQMSMINLGKLDPSVIMRVLVRWEPTIGGVRWHEVVIARRR